MAEFIHAETDQDIIDIISDGISGTGMIGFGAGYDDFYWPVVAYIRDEQKKSQVKASAPAGNIAKGRELFKKHQCASCHWIDGEGGRRGTDLSRADRDCRLCSRVDAKSRRTDRWNSSASEPSR